MNKRKEGRNRWKPSGQAAKLPPPKIGSHFSLRSESFNDRASYLFSELSQKILCRPMECAFVAFPTESFHRAPSTELETEVVYVSRNKGLQLNLNSYYSRDLYFSSHYNQWNYSGSPKKPAIPDHSATARYCRDLRYLNFTLTKTFLKVYSAP